MKRVVLALLLAACGGDDTSDQSFVFDAAAPRVDAQISVGDLDGDGLPDDDEAALAEAYMPYLSVAPSDACPTNGLVVRVTPAEVQGLVRIRYAWLFDRDCEVGYHGVDGAISLLVDPSKPSPQGIIGLRTLSRPASFCQQVSTCGACSGQLSCEDLGGVPAVWAAIDRHAIYATKSVTCTQQDGCMAICADAPTRAMPPVVNVGEPSAPLVHDLTTQGFITSANGWQSQALYDYDPWGGLAFGDAPAVSSLLDGQDPPTCPE